MSVHTRGPLFVALEDDEPLNGGYGYQVHKESNPILDGIKKLEDAYLFAAAPDLLAACEKALESMNDPEFGDFDEVNQLDCMLDAAIKKAGGK